MLFYFFISIVFIAEIIIVLAIIFYIVKLDKKLVECNKFVEEIKPLVKDIMETTRKLSEEFSKLAPKLVDTIKNTAVDFVRGQLKNLLGALTFWLVKKEVEKHA